MSEYVGRRVPDVIFKVRVRDDSIDGPNPFRWEDKTTADFFAGKKVILFSLPGAFTPTCSTYQLPGFEGLYNEFKRQIIIIFIEHLKIFFFSNLVMVDNNSWL